MTVEEKKIVVSGTQISFLGLLAIVFITLKLTGHIAWSWWWVLAPLWVPIAAVVGFFAFVLLMMVLAEFLKYR